MLAWILLLSTILCAVAGWLAFQRAKSSIESKSGQSGETDVSSEKRRPQKTKARAPVKRTDLRSKATGQGKPSVLTHPLLARTLGGHKDAINSFSTSSKTDRLATCSLDQTVRVLLTPSETNSRYITTKIDTKSKEGTMSYPDTALCVALSADASELVLALEKSAKLKHYSLTDSALVPGFEVALQHKGIVQYAAILASKVILTFTDAMEMKLWSPSNGQCLGTLNTHQVKVNDISYSADGRFIATAGFTSDVQVYELQMAKGTQTFSKCKKVMDLRGHNAAVHSVDFCADCKTVATVSRDGTLKLWNIDVRYEFQEDPKVLCSFVPEGPKSLQRVSISPNAKVIAVAERSSVWFYHREGKVLDKIDNTTTTLSPSGPGYGAVLQMEFMADKTHFLTRCEVDKHVRMWKVPVL